MGSARAIPLAARLRAAVSPLARAVWSVRAELLHNGAIVFGWTLVTWGVATLIDVWQVWPISGGLLLLSLAGWGHLRVLFSAGIYALTRRSS